jgi:hypothetical protein
MYIIIMDCNIDEDLYMKYNDNILEMYIILKDYFKKEGLFIFNKCDSVDFYDFVSEYSAGFTDYICDNTNDL